MRYYRALTDGEVATGPIRVSWLLGGYYQISSRTRDDRYEGRYRYDRWQQSDRYPCEKWYGRCVEIEEQEAMELDPEHFRDGVIWDSYERFKSHDAEWEAKKQGTKTKAKSNGGNSLWK